MQAIEFTDDESDQEIEIEYISSISNLHPCDMNAPSISKEEDLMVEEDMRMEVEMEEEDEQKVERLVSDVCEELSEPKKELVFKVVKMIGCKQTELVLRQTRSVEAAGGMFTNEGGVSLPRRKAIGGVFFTLIKNLVGSQQYKSLMSIDKGMKVSERKRQRLSSIQEWVGSSGTRNLEDEMNMYNSKRRRMSQEEDCGV